MRRRLVWIEASFWGWCCSECAWVFNSSGTPTGRSLDEMKQNYEQQRDKEFAAHVCAEHPRVKNRKRRRQAGNEAGEKSSQARETKIRKAQR